MIEYYAEVKYWSIIICRDLGEFAPRSWSLVFDTVQSWMSQVGIISNSQFGDCPTIGESKKLHLAAADFR